jgi:hypothetical protein
MPAMVSLTGGTEAPAMPTTAAVTI